MNGLYKSAIGTIYGDCLRVVDIVDNEITFSTCNHTNIIAHTRSTRLEITQHTIRQNKTDGVCQIHTRLALYTQTLHLYNIGREEHPDKVEGIDTQIEQGTTTEVWSHDTLFVSHRVPQCGSHHTRCTDTSHTDKVANNADSWLIACPDGFCQKDMTLMSQLHDFFSLSEEWLTALQFYSSTALSSTSSRLWCEWGVPTYTKSTSGSAINSLYEPYALPIFHFSANASAFACEREPTA